MLTYKEFSKLYPKCENPKQWVDAMNNVFPKYEITTAKRIASFISQCGHESAGWSVFIENLNYSERSLNSLFGKYFYKAGRDASKYARQPEKIANIVYANRMGNGNEASGDGWRYRGRGPIQLTGKNNYIYFSHNMEVDAINNPDLLVNDPEISLMSAIWYWNNNNLNVYADKGDIRSMTKKINGGYIGLSDRLEHYDSALAVLSNRKIFDTENIEVLQLGSQGEAVEMLQKKLGIKVDGDFGDATEKALKEWQVSKGLAANGIANKNILQFLLKQA